MNKIFNKVKKADPADMNISDMKLQILERLRAKKESGASVVESAKPAVNADDILNALKKSDKPAATDGGVSKKEFEDLSRHHDKIKEELGKKDALALDLQKRHASELDELTRDRDRAAANVEGLRSKLYAATKEAKENLARITQLEELSRSREKKTIELDKLNSELNAAKIELESKLRSAESSNKNLEEKMRTVGNELTHGTAKLTKLEKSYKDLESEKNALSLQLQAGIRDKKDLEAKIGQMHLEVTAKANRLAETGKLYKELEAVVNDLTVKLQASQRDKKDLEASNADYTLKLQNAQRDKKELEARISQLSSELEAGVIRMEEADKLYREMEMLVKDATAKRQESDKRAEGLEAEVVNLDGALKKALGKLKESEDVSKEEIARLTTELAAMKSMQREQAKRELELRNSVEHLTGEVETRDSKIEGDLKYTDKLVKEVGELRKKVAGLERQAKG